MCWSENAASQQLSKQQPRFLLLLLLLLLHIVAFLMCFFIAFCILTRPTISQPAKRPTNQPTTTTTTYRRATTSMTFSAAHEIQHFPHQRDHFRVSSFYQMAAYKLVAKAKARDCISCKNKIHRHILTYADIYS